MDLNAYIGHIALATLVTGLALLAEHIALWNRPWRLTPPGTYIVGGATWVIGCGVWAAQQARLGPISPWLAAIAFGIIGIGGGAVVVIAYYVRGVRSLIERNSKTKQQISEVLDDGPLGDIHRN